MEDAIKETKEESKKSSKEKCESKEILKLKDEISSLKEKIEMLKKSENDAKENLLRHAAEFDNTRKRLQKSKDEAIKYANKNILLHLIDILDDFDRALDHKEDKEDPFYKGVKMIRDRLYSTLESDYGLKYLEVLGEEFNPELHEAISMIDDESHTDKQIILEEFQKGYLFEENILRTAKVVVSKLKN